MGIPWQRARPGEGLRHERTPVLAIAMVALALRLLYFTQIPAIPTYDLPAPGRDTDLYDTIARNVLAGQWLRVLYRQQGKTDEAARELASAVALAPGAASLDAQIQLALSLEEVKRYREARERWTAILAIESSGGIATLGQRHLIRIERALGSEGSVRGPGRR